MALALFLETFYLHFFFGFSKMGHFETMTIIGNSCKKIADFLTPSEIRVKYQYSGWNTNITSSVRKAVRNVFDNGFELTNKPILYFYNPDICESSWHETQKYILTEGSHRFFAEV